MAYLFDNELRDEIEARLRGFQRAELHRGELKRAAVAITVVPHGPQASFLLTRRAPRMNAHAGQWALPGGRLDKGEDAVEAALRELREEVALDIAPAQVLGMLDDYPTRSGYLITPVVVWAADTSAMTPNPGEVASIHSFALDELTRPDSPVFLEIPESERPVIRLLIGDSHVHAPTAAVLYQFGEVGLRGKETRVAELEQPVWAWR
ncbi:CoA pyrophosphatase [Parvibaculum sp.]|jgi:8-oxo-dGTP pyrophosphatase MutT (NUDIX family)|uniref:NUDIX hydrolase n=1 Tax=Parvibaculum sp. TaxID=2024848 RepID=UPI000C37CF83|nr:CoA pyrophosphatase [Parvibaculum sp.]MAM93063.1 coenzyme A pyrophosphatase [Parvibaculum sp.]HCX69059.1 CoA pyrophosphatase [Rhodobiaceae bacterium]|tara:strand:- start:5297 stop:5917 length:621 start_codon:yes stop_codon:yes gene_type:complete